MALGARLASWNEGSLLRRTLFHVGTFVLGSVAFLAIASLILVSIAKGLLPSHEPTDSEAAATSATSTSKPLTPPRFGKRRPGSPAAEPPPEDDAKEE